MLYTTSCIYDGLFYRKDAILLKNTANMLLQFRKMQLFMIALNTTFKRYLKFFSTVLYSIVSLLTFGSIRLFLRDPIPNMMLPICALRCGVEATTLLGIAGDVSTRSKQLLQIWRTSSSVSFRKSFRKKGKEARLVQRSCKRILCTAGSLYTFENSIVLTSVDNCIQLTCNYLVTF